MSQQQLLDIGIGGLTEFKALLQMMREYETGLANAAKGMRVSNAATEKQVNDFRALATTLGLINKELKPLTRSERELAAAQKENLARTKAAISWGEKRRKGIDDNRRALERFKRTMVSQNKVLMQQGQGWSNVLGRFPKIQGFFAGTTKEARMFSDTMGLLAGNILRLGVTMGAMVIAGRVVVRMFEAFGRIMDKPITAGAEMERHTIRFTALLQDEAEAIKRVGEAADLSFTTPFHLQQVVKASATLEGFGLGAEVNLRRAANMAAAFSVSIEDAALALGKLKLGQFERLEKFGITRAQLAIEAGISYSLIRTNTPETLELMWTEAIKLIEQRTKGAADRMSASYEGIVSNIAGEWERINLIISDMGALDARKVAAQNELNIVRSIREEYEFMATLSAGREFVKSTQESWGEVLTLNEQIQLGNLRILSFSAIATEIGITIAKWAPGVSEYILAIDRAAGGRLPSVGDTMALRADLASAAEAGATNLLTIQMEQIGVIQAQGAFMNQLPPAIQLMIELEEQRHQAELKYAEWIIGREQKAADQIKKIREEIKWLSTAAGAAAAQAVKAAQDELKALKESLGLTNKKTKAKEDELDAYNKLVEAQDKSLVNLQAQNRLLLEGDPIVRQNILLEQIKTKELKEQLDLLDRMALLSRGELTVAQAGIAPFGPELPADQLPFQGPPIPEGLEEAWQAMEDAADRSARAQRVAIRSIGEAVREVGESMEENIGAAFDNQLKFAFAFKDIMKNVFKDMALAQLEAALVPLKTERDAWIIKAGIAAASGDWWGAAKYTAGAGAMSALIGGARGLAEVGLDRALGLNEQGADTAGATGRDREGKAKSRNLLSMRGAGVINIYFTYHLEIHGNVITSDQEWTDSQARNIEDAYERGVYPNLAA